MLSGASQISSLLSIESLIWVFGCHVPGLLSSLSPSVPSSEVPGFLSVSLKPLYQSVQLHEAQVMATHQSSGHPSLVSACGGHDIDHHWPVWDMGPCMKGHIRVPLKPLITWPLLQVVIIQNLLHAPLLGCVLFPDPKPRGDIHLCLASVSNMFPPSGKWTSHLCDLSHPTLIVPSKQLSVRSDPHQCKWKTIN